MPMFDIVCENGHEQRDVMLRSGERPLCLHPWGSGTCNLPTSTLWTGKAANVVSDGIPGGIWIRHGLCNADGSPKRYDSHTDIKREAKKRNYTNLVEHVPLRGTDKSPHTTRWI